MLTLVIEYVALGSEIRLTFVELSWLAVMSSLPVSARSSCNNTAAMINELCNILISNELGVVICEAWRSSVFLDKRCQASLWFINGLLLNTMCLYLLFGYIR